MVRKGMCRQCLEPAAAAAFSVGRLGRALGCLLLGLAAAEFERVTLAGVTWAAVHLRLEPLFGVSCGADKCSRLYDDQYTVMLQIMNLFTF